MLSNSQQNNNFTVDQSEFQASISPVTNTQHPTIISSSNTKNKQQSISKKDKQQSISKKDKQQFAAYQNFVKNIQIQHKLNQQSSHNNQYPPQKLQLSKKQPNQSTNLSNKQQKFNHTHHTSKNKQKFTQFLQEKHVSRKHVQTASSCTNLRITKNQQFKISHVPTTAKILTSTTAKIFPPGNAKPNTQVQQIKKFSPEQLKGKPYIQKKPRRQLQIKQQKQTSLTKQPQLYQQVKLRVQKLPQLIKTDKIIQNIKQPQQAHRIQEFKDVQAIIRKKKIQKLKSDLSLSPILKTFQPRYFGLQNKSINYQKLGHQLLIEIKNKYWCYDNIENEEVYQNFQHFLCSDLNKLTKS